MLYPLHPGAACFSVLSRNGNGSLKADVDVKQHQYNHSDIQLIASNTIMSLPSNATLKVLPFKVNIADSCVEELKTLLKLSKLPPPTYEGTQTNMGVTRQWVADTKEKWENEFDWSVAGSYCTRVIKSWY